MERPELLLSVSSYLAPCSGPASPRLEVNHTRFIIFAPIHAGYDGGLFTNTVPDFLLAGFHLGAVTWHRYFN